RFTHELLRRAVYDRLSHASRAELHLRAGEALERTYAADPAPVVPELAHHFTLAAPLGGVERAVDYNLRASDAACTVSAYEEAVARLSAALELGIADPRERARVQLELAHIGSFTFTRTAAEIDALLAESLDAATRLGERGIAARALLYQYGLRKQGDPEFDPAESRTVGEHVIETLTELGDVPGLAWANRGLGMMLRRQGRMAESCAALERALVHAEDCGDQFAL